MSENRWETVTVVPAPRYHAGIVSIHKRIYFIGGFHSDSLFDRATGKYYLYKFNTKHLIFIIYAFVSASVDCYDLETNSWSSEEKYPQDVWEHTCITLYVPRCRDDMEVLPLSK